MRLSRKTLPEGVRSDILLGNFQPYQSRGWQFINTIVSHPVSCNGLVSIATVFSEVLQIPLSRDYMRRKALVIKWFDENIDKILPWRNIISIEYAEYHDLSDPTVSDDKTNQSSEITTA